MSLNLLVDIWMITSFNSSEPPRLMSQIIWVLKFMYWYTDNSICNPKIQNLMCYKIWSFLNQHETETNQKFSTWLHASHSQSQPRNRHTANTVQIIFRLCVKMNSVFKWVPCSRNFILYRCKYCSFNVIKRNLKRGSKHFK